GSPGAFPCFSSVSSLDPTLAYHTYQMIYNPANPLTVDFYIDGTRYATEGSYGNNGQARLEWGRGQGTGGISETEWSLVSFELGQHPLSQVVVQHVGTNNPTTEGFVFN